MLRCGLENGGELGTVDTQKPDDFRIFLYDEYRRRSAKNPAYSLRAFAKSVGLTSSELSKLLGGKRRLTKKELESVARSCGLSADEQRHYLESLPVAKDRRMF